MLKYLSITTLFLLSLFCSVDSAAQGPANPAERQRWISEIRSYKHDFISKELNLTREQENAFFPIYDEMEEQIEKLNNETRELERRVSEDENASDLELQNAARTIFELKRAEGQIEMTYFDKFSEILTPRQLVQLKPAERKFTQQLINSHRRARRQGSQR